MLTSVQIRPARPEEYRAVGKLTVDVYLGDELVPPGAMYLNTLVDAADRAARAELIVAVDAGGSVVGSVTFAQHGSPYAELAGADEVEVRMLVVAPPARGQGLGEALVRTCLDQARAAGAVRVRLSTQENMVGAHPIYRRLGFVRTPERDWSPVADVNLLTYELPLG
ncbi:MAG TPA: GNAT family N-acetyltransferase [Kineosporiaceae bacterium]|nr:GNAT family N-acetyltransferase [Kineosporiaceae bacterium]